MLFGEALFSNYCFEILTLSEQCNGDDIYFPRSLNLKIKCYLVKHYTIITALRFLLFMNSVRGMICIFTKPHQS